MSAHISFKKNQIIAYAACQSGDEVAVASSAAVTAAASASLVLEETSISRVRRTLLATPARRLGSTSTSSSGYF